MKMKAAAMASALLVLLAGCASTATRLSRVQNGMSRDQVIALLGSPDGARVRADIEYLTYYLPDETGRREQPYMVRLVGARVESVGRFVQLADLEAAGGRAPQAGMGAILSPPAFPDLATQLRQLADLKARGELTEAEFVQARQELLAANR